MLSPFLSKLLNVFTKLGAEEAGVSCPKEQPRVMEIRRITLIASILYYVCLLSAGIMLVVCLLVLHVYRQSSYKGMEEHR